MRFEDIRCVAVHFNTPSLIDGYDAANPVEDFIVQDFRIGDVVLKGPDDLHRFTSHARGIVYRSIGS